MKQILVKSLLDAFPEVEGDEVEAMVTHWLHSPMGQMPFLTADMRDHCWSLVDSVASDGVRARHAKEAPAAYQARLQFSWDDIPFPPPDNPTFTFVDLFAGIGGFRIAMQQQGGKCVFSSEWDSHAKKTYEANFGEVPFGDIRKIAEDSIPQHDILCAGFPCQPFSIAGVSKKISLGRKHGFEDEKQGNLFFILAEIIRRHKPKAFILENVKNLRNHDKGNTFTVITQMLEEELGYNVKIKVIDAQSVVPQHRERIFFVGFLEECGFNFPGFPKVHPKLRSILQDNPDPKYTLSDHLWNYLKNYAKKHAAAGNGFGFGLFSGDDTARTLSARYHKDGSEILIRQDGESNPRRLTPRECARLMGYPDDFRITVSDTQAYRQFGNSVVVPVVEALAKEVVSALHSSLNHRPYSENSVREEPETMKPPAILHKVLKPKGKAERPRPPSNGRKK